jgi:hypothetical protein
MHKIVLVVLKKIGLILFMGTSFVFLNKLFTGQDYAILPGLTFGVLSAIVSLRI